MQVSSQAGSANALHSGRILWGRGFADLDENLDAGANDKSTDLAVLLAGDDDDNLEAEDEAIAKPDQHVHVDPALHADVEDVDMSLDADAVALGDANLRE